MMEAHSEGPTSTYGGFLNHGGYPQIMDFNVLFFTTSTIQLWGYFHLWNPPCSDMERCSPVGTWSALGLSHVVSWGRPQFWDDDCMLRLWWMILCGTWVKIATQKDDDLRDVDITNSGSIDKQFFTIPSPDREQRGKAKQLTKAGRESRVVIIWRVSKVSGVQLHILLD